MDPNIKEMIEAGAMHESEAPFDDNENKFDEPDEKEKIKLPYTLELMSPFDYSSNRKVTELVFVNRLTTGMTMHLPMSGDHQRGHYVPIIAGMTGESVSLIKKLGPQDFISCVSVLMDFF